MSKEPNNYFKDTESNLLENPKNNNSNIYLDYESQVLSKLDSAKFSRLTINRVVNNHNNNNNSFCNSMKNFTFNSNISQSKLTQPKNISKQNSHNSSNKNCNTSNNKNMINKNNSNNNSSDKNANIILNSQHSLLNNTSFDFKEMPFNNKGIASNYDL